MKYIFRVFLCVTFCINVTLGFSQKDQMPIIAYWGVPEERTTDADFQTFSECGFTVSLYPYKSLKALIQACRCAEKYNIKILGKCPEILYKPKETADILKKENGFWGYVMQDEPTIWEIRKQQKIIEQIKSIDNTHLFYINLLPYQQSDLQWVYSVTKAKSYEEYLRAATISDCQQISFDHYPITTHGLRDTWYHNLEMVRKESLKAGKPFWGFVLSVPHADYPPPTIASLRLQIYSNLAYGAQAIQYFTYWTPANNKKYDFHNAPIKPNGRKSLTYFLVKQMNKELTSIARVFYGARVLSVNHLGVIAKGTTLLSKTPQNIQSIKINGKKGALISQFTKDEHNYLAIINKDYEDMMTLYITTKNDVPRYLTKELQEQPMKSSYTIAAGDIILFKLK